MAYFVMLRSQGGFPLPLIDLEEDICLFDSHEAASKAGRQHIIGEAFGFTVYEWEANRG
jgi:hypothetical protein